MVVAARKHHFVPSVIGRRLAGAARQRDPISTHWSGRDIVTIIGKITWGLAEPVACPLNSGRVSWLVAYSPARASTERRMR